MTVFQLDRMNLASALTGGFMDAIHVNQNTINLGNQLMFLGIVVLEIPSNMLLQQVRIRYIHVFLRIKSGVRTYINLVKYTDWSTQMDRSTGFRFWCHCNLSDLLEV